MSLTVILIIVTVAASFYAWSSPEVMAKWMMNPYAVVRHGEYQRFITSGFIHQDYLHLGFNMFSFYIFGEIVERVYQRQYGGGLGSALFVGMYLVGIVLSDVPTYLKHRGNAHYNSLGASGGVSAIIFASIFFNPLNKLIIFPIPFAIPGFMFGGLYLFYSYYQSRRGDDHINHDAHLYGAVFGIAFAVLTIPGAFTDFANQIAGFRFRDLLP